MDGGSTIWAPNADAATALPDIAQCPCTEANPSSKGCGGVTAWSRCRGSVVVLEWALVY